MKLLVVDDEYLAREDLQAVLRECLPLAAVLTAGSGQEALELCRSSQFDIAFLDIEMPDMSGLKLARKLMELKQNLNIVFVTAYNEYALSAFKLYASAFLTKPVRKDEILDALQHLRFPLTSKENGLYIRCFGKFEVFSKGQPVFFKRSKAKELLAYLINLQGVSANVNELCSVLWEDNGTPENQKNYFRHIVCDLRRTLASCGAEDILIHNRNSYAIDTEKTNCDLFRYQRQEPDAVASYRGEYMNQYSWAEFYKVE